MHNAIQGHLGQPTCVRTAAHMPDCIPPCQKEQWTQLAYVRPEDILLVQHGAGQRCAEGQEHLNQTP